MKKTALILDVMLWFVILFGLTETVFSLHGLAFIAQLVLLVGILCIAILAMLLINVGVRFGHLLSGFASAIALLDLTLIYFLRGQMPLLHFGALACAMVAFVFDIMLVGGSSRKVLLKTYTKVVAAKNAKTYHLPDSPEAKRIKDKREFNSEEEAKKAGLKPGPSLK